MVNVVSSNLRAIGFDPTSQTMRVEFNNGSMWDYAGVSQETFNAVLNAESVGKAYNALIKGGGYAGTKVA